MHLHETLPTTCTQDMNNTQFTQTSNPRELDIRTDLLFTYVRVNKQRAKKEKNVPKKNIHYPGSAKFSLINGQLILQKSVGIKTNQPKEPKKTTAPTFPQYSHENNIKHGNAVLRYPSGSVLYCNYNNQGVREGEAYYVSSMGSCKLFFVNDIAEGPAEATFNDGSRIKTSMENGLAQGEAEKTLPDGTSFKFHFHNGAAISQTPKKNDESTNALQPNDPMDLPDELLYSPIEIEETEDFISDEISSIL
jgi:antitoxin component YwqK of YwqJK toxin-antitoxin module